MKLDESHIGRRRFVGGMLAGGAAALGAAVAAPLAPYTGNLREEPLPEFLAIPESEVPQHAGDSAIVMYGRVPALLLRLPQPEAALRVFVATCTHFDCTVSYQRDKNRIFCACHDGCFDLEGQVTAGPPPKPLMRFHMAQGNGQLIIALEKENLEKALGET